jgi:hypothetical protein
MATLTVDRPVSARKRKDPPPESMPPDESTALLSIKLSADVVKSARIVASLTDQSMSDLLGGILRPILKKMEDEGFAKRMRNRGEGKSS